MADGDLVRLVEQRFEEAAAWRSVHDAEWTRLRPRRRFFSSHHHPGHWQIRARQKSRAAEYA